MEATGPPRRNGGLRLVVRGRMTLQDVRVPVLGTCPCVTSCGKGKSLQGETSLLIS